MGFNLWLRAWEFKFRVGTFGGLDPSGLRSFEVSPRLRLQSRGFWIPICMELDGQGIQA